MLQARTDTWAHTGRAIRLVLATLALAAALTAALLGARSAPPTAHAAAPFRAFSPASPWNIPVDPASIAASNPWADQFGGGSNTTLTLSGSPDNPKFAAPIFFAQPGDPLAPVDVGSHDSFASANTHYDGRPIPVPAGVAPAPGSDGHLTVVSADRHWAWDMWRCTQAGPGGYVTEWINQWDLTGMGYSNVNGANSARGSGTPLISTSLRADEALNGFQHALGLTVPSVGDQPIYPPASHSDGNDGANAIQYGMRFVLRPDYPVSPGAPVGVRNVAQALKTYGVFIVDQGADFELDADSTHPEIWAQTGLSEQALPFTTQDFRPAQTGAYVPVRAASNGGSARRRGRAVLLRVNTHKLWVGGQLRIRGHVRRGFPAGSRVRIDFRTRGQRHWHRLRRKPVEANGRFATWPRLTRPAHASRFGAQILRLRDRHLSSRARIVRIRAFVHGVGKSRVIRIRIRH